MPVCAKLVQTPGGDFLTLDPTQTNLGACQYVLQTGTESLYGSLADLSPADAAYLSGLVCLVWAVAWAIRQAIRSLSLGENHAAND